MSGAPGLAYRFIGAAEDADSFRDFVSMERRFIAPSLLWAPDDRLDVLAAVEYIHQEGPYDSGILFADVPPSGVALCRARKTAAQRQSSF